MQTSDLFEPVLTSAIISAWCFLHDSLIIMFAALHCLRYASWSLSTPVFFHARSSRHRFCLARVASSDFCNGASSLSDEQTTTRNIRQLFISRGNMLIDLLTVWMLLYSIFYRTISRHLRLGKNYLNCRQSHILFAASLKQTLMY